MADNYIDAVAWLRKRGEKKLAAGQGEEALEFYRRMLHFGRDDPKIMEEAHARLGDVLLALRNLSEAEDHVLAAIGLNSNHAHYHYLLGIVYTAGKNWKKALPCFGEAVRLAPGNAEYLRGTGWALVCTGKMNRGEQSLWESLKIDPENTWTVSDLGVTLMQKGRYKEAETLVRNSLDKHPTDYQLRDVMDGIRRSRRAYEDTKKRQRARGQNPLPGKQGLVDTLLARRMAEDGYDYIQVESACRMWRDFARRRQFVIKKPEVWAAAIEYTIARLDFLEDVTQRKMADKYGVSEGVISDHFQNLCGSLNITHFDERYCSFHPTDNPSP